MGATYGWTMQEVDAHISIHAPAMGATRRVTVRLHILTFQSTRPRWARLSLSWSNTTTL